MSTGVSAILEIGGPIPHHLVEELCGAITDEAVSLDWGDAWFEPESAEDLLDAAVEDGPLRLLDESSHGNFDVEELLREHGIPFDRMVDADSEGPGSVIKFRPGMSEPRYFTGDCTGDTYLEREKALSVLAMIEKRQVGTAIAALRHDLGLDIPPLPPFTIAAETGAHLT